MSSILSSHSTSFQLIIYRWYCHLQNDCKNIFSSDTLTAKGALAEDLTNGDYTYPILVGLYSSEPTRAAISKVFECRRENKEVSSSALRLAIEALQSEEVRSMCLTELEAARQRNSELAVLWGRQEEMTLA